MPSPAHCSDLAAEALPLQLRTKLPQKPQAREIVFSSPNSHHNGRRRVETRRREITIQILQVRESRNQPNAPPIGHLKAANADLLLAMRSDSPVNFSQELVDSLQSNPEVRALNDGYDYALQLDRPAVWE